MRIKKNIMIVAALAAAAVFTASCSQDETIDERQVPSKGAIGFMPNLKGATSTTRIVDSDHSYSSSSKLPNSFDVWAYTFRSSGSQILYMGADGENADGIMIKKATQAGVNELGWYGSSDVYWGYDQQGEVTYWPAEPLKFYAIAPAFTTTMQRVPVTPTISNPRFSSAGGYFDCKITDGNMDDILVGMKEQEAVIGSEASYNVQFSFRHALAKVKFKGKLNSNVNRALRIQISTIEICNILSEGTCFVDSASWKSKSGFAPKSASDYSSGAIQWGKYESSTFTANVNSETDHTNHVKTWATYQLAGSKNIGFKSTSSNPNVSESSFTETVNGDSVTFNSEVVFDSIVVVPQYITNWKNKDLAGTETVQNAVKAEAGATSSVGTYIHIQYKLVSQNDVKILDGTSTLVDAYVPLPTSLAWQPGYSYTYTLLFGLGNKADGTSLGAPITFSVGVGTWTDSTSTSNINLAN